MINPQEALDINDAHLVFSGKYNTQKWINNLEEFILQSLLESNYGGV